MTKAPAPLITLEIFTLPFPPIVEVKLFVYAPVEIVSAFDASSLLILAAEDTVIAPVIVFAPLIFLITPSLLIPVPKIVMGLLTNATPPSMVIALPLLIVIIPVVPKTLVLVFTVGLTFKILLFAFTVIAPENKVLFPFNVNILPAPTPSFVIAPTPDSAPLISTSPSPPIVTALVTVIEVALFNVNKVASEFILELADAMVIVPDKVLPALVLGTLMAPVPVTAPVPFIEKCSDIVAPLISNLTAAPEAIEVLSDVPVPFPKPVAVFKTTTPVLTVVVPE